MKKKNQSYLKFRLHSSGRNSAAVAWSAQKMLTPADDRVAEGKLGAPGEGDLPVSGRRGYLQGTASPRALKPQGVGLLIQEQGHPAVRVRQSITHITDSGRLVSAVRYG